VKDLKLQRPSAAMLVAIIALVFAVGGGAVMAKKKKKKTKLAPNSVTTKAIKDAAVTTPKLTTAERSEGFQVRQTGEIDLPAGAETNVATLSLPAGGRYLVIAEASLGKNATTQVPCTLKDDGTVLQQGDVLVNGAADYTHTMTLSGFADGGNVTLSCKATAAAKAQNRTIDAIRVASVTG
jgi:hypothetical protein